jgi:3-methyladenine DNA glycosylase AlkD
LRGRTNLGEDSSVAARSRPAASSKGNGVDQALAWLEKKGSQQVRDGMARFAIPSDRAFGISVGALRAYAKTLGQDHALALALWRSGWYEARLLAAFVGDPAALDAALMNSWAKDFDNWAVCDTVCFALFDRTPLAWGRLKPWASARAEFHKRGAFALLWSLSVHDKHASDERFIEHLPLLEAAAADERDYVKKGVDMALRAIGKRSAPLHAAALELAAQLSESEAPSAAWIGRSTQRELSKIRPRGSKKKARGR